MLTLLLLLAAPPAKPAPTAPPDGLTKPDAVTKPDDLYPPPDPTVRLPLPESLLKANQRSFAVRPAGGGSTLYAGTTPLREFGPDRQSADAALRAVQGLDLLTDWGTVGGRANLDYALANGRAAPTHPDGGRHQGARTIDLRSVRAEGVRGTWVVRDDLGILANCGPDSATAEQAAAVCKRYGFNRLLAIGGRPDAPAFRMLFAAPADARPDVPADPFVATFQNQTLTRTGVQIPGGGYAGERVVLDPKAVEARRERGDWVLAHGREVLARFGGDEGGAREAARLLTDSRMTEWCVVGGLTFFLARGQPPTRVPFAARSQPFDPGQLQPVPLDGKWAVAAGGRTLFPAASEAEAKQMIEVMKAYRFDTLCQMGSDPRAGLRFLARINPGSRAEHTRSQ